MEQEEKLSIITRVEQQKKNSRRYNVYIDDSFAFGVHEDVLVKYRLIKGKELDKQEYKEILEAEERKKVEHKALRFLSYRARSRQEMQQYLRQQEYDLALIEDVLRELEVKKLIDDRQFAKQWSEDRILYKQKGPLMIKAELQQKGLAASDIEEAMENINDQEALSACLKLGQKKWEQLKKEQDARKREYKLKQYLLRRGYTYEQVQFVWEDLLQS